MADDDRKHTLPDARDGMTRAERIVLWQLHELRKELGERPIPTAMLYGRVVEHVNISESELQAILGRFVGVG